MGKLFGAILTILAMNTGAALADTGARITVTGQGEVNLAPDMAILSLGSTLRDDTAPAVLERSAEVTSALLDGLVAAGVAEADIQTQRAALRPVFARDTNGQNSELPVAFEANNIVTVQVGDLSTLGTVYSAAADAGATRFDGLSFTLSDPSDADQEAREAAVADAKERAETYAAASGLSLGPVIEIVEGGRISGPMPMRAAAMDEGAMIAAPGSVTVRAQITIIYALTE